MTNKAGRPAKSRETGIHRTVVDETSLKVPAPRSNWFFVHGYTQDRMGRITFFEKFEPDHVGQPRCAVTMTASDMIELADLIYRIFGNYSKAKEAVNDDG